MRCYPTLLIFPQFSSKIASRSQFHDGFCSANPSASWTSSKWSAKLVWGARERDAHPDSKKKQNFLGALILHVSKKWTWNWMKLEDVHQRGKSCKSMAQGGEKMMVAIQISSKVMGPFSHPLNHHMKGFFLLRKAWCEQDDLTKQNPPSTTLNPPLKKKLQQNSL